MLSSRPYLVLLLLNRGRDSTGGPLLANVCFLQGVTFFPDETYSTGSHQGTVWLPVTMVLCRFDWLLKAGSESRLNLKDCNTYSCGHLPISFHNTLTFPINHVTASAFFLHRCVLWREIFNWRLCQQSICNKRKEKRERKTKNPFSILLFLVNAWLSGRFPLTTYLGI